MSSISGLPSLQACTSKIYRPAGGVSGLRLIQNGASRIAVWAFPMAEATSIALPRAVSAIAYVLLSHDMAYFGESKNGLARVVDHLADPTKSFAREAYVVTGYPEPWPDKLPAIYLQYRLWSIAQAAGHLNIANVQRPQTPVAANEDRGLLERYVEDARLLLRDGGCHALDSNFASQRRLAPPVEQDEDTIVPEDMVPIRIDVIAMPPIGGELELDYMGLWARGYPSEGGFVVLPGAEFRTAVNASAQEIIKTRRAQLNDAGALVEIAGVGDRSRLLVALWFPSPAIAAKVVTGAHIGSRVWVPRRYPKPILIAN
jgi:Fe-S cluster assembly iron-binding protein IscA